MCYTVLHCVCVGEVGASRPYPGGNLWVTVHCTRGIPEEVCRLPSAAGEVGVCVTYWDIFKVELTSTLSTFLLLLLSPSILPNFRGQVMNAEMLSNVVDVELISEGVKYSLKVQRTSSSIAVF